MKTNVTRMLESHNIPFKTVVYEVDEEDLSGLHAAQFLGVPPEQMFKTLVVKGERRGYFVCCIPCCEELDLKKASRAAGDKKADMIHMKELLPVTGYVRGGCSPIGMKKKFPTYIDETAALFDEIYVSAGARGVSIQVNPEALARFVEGNFVDLTK